MVDLKAFREANNLRQLDLATFLETSRVFISQVESGKSKLPPEQLSKLLKNDQGWDVSMLQEEDPEESKEISIDSVYRELLKEKDSRILELKERIQELKETISILKSQKGIQSVSATKDVPAVFVPSQNL
jgi:transcriptional regulator with XRE-family HTH domain